MNDPKLTQSVVRYHTEKAKIKARQRIELEAELETFAADVGDEIQRLRTEGHASINDVSAIIGVQNRTFIYKMIDASKNRSTPKEVPTEDVTEDDDSTPLYVIEWHNNDTLARVVFDETEHYDIPVIDGSPDLPEEWAEHTRERRDLYKQIAKQIREH